MNNFVSQDCAKLADLFVDEVLLADALELGKFVAPIKSNAVWVIPAQKRVIHRPINQDFHHLFKVPLLWIKLLKS